MNQFQSVAELVAQGHLDLPIDALSFLTPPSKHTAVSFDRIAGMLLGVAIGEALGNTTESQLPAKRRSQHGEIGDYLRNRDANNKRVGLPSDDTQLTFWTLECLLRDGRVVPDALLEAFSARDIFGIGKTVAAAISAYRRGAPWHSAGQRSAGNGALMRIAPVIVPHIHEPSSELWADAILAGAVTHNDRTSIAACVAFVSLLWDVLAMTQPPNPEWWLDGYCDRARYIEGEVQLRSRHPSLGYHGPVWRFIDTEVRATLKAKEPVIDACNRWYSGAYLLETVPAVLYILARYASDPEQAILRAVNDTKDNDTIAAIVGSAVGALHGRSALPMRWVSGLAGRTTADDDGRVGELIDQVHDWREFPA